MGLHSPRGKFERLDILLAGKIWVGRGESRRTVAATCRNLSGRGCKLQIEDAQILSELTVDSRLEFSIQLEPIGVPVEGTGKIAWVRQERGEEARTRLVVGLEYTSVPTIDRERIKAFIYNRLESQM